MNAGTIKTFGVAAIAGITLAVPAVSQAVSPNPNPWLTKRFINIAHQGGEDEAPSSTLFAFKSAMASRGADAIELDVNLSQDGELMVIHDDAVDRTTNGPQLREDSVADTDGNPATDSSEVDRLTKAEIQALDAGYWFRPGSYSHDPGIPASEFIYRGIATGAVPPPPGYTATDFRIPTLREVLDAFPTTPVNIEIKMEKSIGGAGGGCETEPSGIYCDDPAGSTPTAVALAALLDEDQYESRQDIIVVSFSDALVEDFYNADAGPKTALAPGINDAALYATIGQTPNPDVAAFQVPPRFGTGPLAVDVPAQLLQFHDAHADGYAVHVWPNDQEPESEASYARMLSLGVDGYMASEPLRLHNYLCGAGVRRPDGGPRCPAQVLPPTVQPTTTTAPTPKKCKKGKRLKKGKCVKKKRKKRKGKS